MNTKKIKDISMASFLKSWRLSESISQKEFAELLEISPANLCDIEKKRKGVSPEKAHKIGLILGYPPAILVKIALQDQLRSAGLKYDIELKKSCVKLLVKL